MLHCTLPFGGVIITAADGQKTVRQHRCTQEEQRESKLTFVKKRLKTTLCRRWSELRFWVFEKIPRMAISKMSYALYKCDRNWSSAKRSFFCGCV